MYTVLIADDEEDIRYLIAATMQAKGYECILVSNGLEALKELEKNTIDLIITDVMMPHLDGFNLVRTIREGSKVPVIFLSARGEDMDKILGLGLGADDYIVKPVHMGELAARAEAHLRRNQIYDKKELTEISDIQIGNYTLIEETGIFQINGQEVELLAKEYKLIAFFMKNPERVLTKKQIYSAVWEDDYYYDDNTVTVTLSRLRSKIETDRSKCIHTIRGLGYRFSVKGK